MAEISRPFTADAALVALDDNRCCALTRSALPTFLLVRNGVRETAADWDD